LRKRPLEKQLKKSKVWFHYIDTFVIWRHGELHKFLIFLNNQHSNIFFIIDIKENGKLPFPDVLVSKKVNGILSYQETDTHR